ncbi:MAG: molybdenum cofactor biosynthesis protein MoaE, partial [Candidatus Bathyarchaeota archaeon]|nr:molybdenum cofactor biosynthesis protein MoaE [Candidatus Bathyarchaeota archaeon]
MVIMEKVKLVGKGEIDLGKVINSLKENLGDFDYGAILCFIGVVRSIGHNGEKVKHLYYEVDEKYTLKFLEDLRVKILEENKGLTELIIYHCVGEVPPKNETVLIVAAGKHSEDVFNGVKKALKGVKEEVPVWKK